MLLLARRWWLCVFILQHACIRAPTVRWRPSKGCLVGHAHSLVPLCPFQNNVQFHVVCFEATAHSRNYDIVSSRVEMQPHHQITCSLQPHLTLS